ncbi:MAG: hypothetical protein RIE08_08870 [Acidimicrobiales bacterium]
MSKTESRVVDWLGGVTGDGESLTDWAILGYPSAGSSHSSRALDEYIDQRGLDPAAQVGQGYTQMIVIVTDLRLMFAGVGGVIGVRPKKLVVEAPIDSIRLEWWDQREVGPDRRWLLFMLGEQWLRHVAAITDRSNIESFTTALGDLASRVR